MALSLNSFSTFLNNAAAAVQAQASAITDFSVGSVSRALMEAASGLGMWLQWQIVQVLALTRASTCSGTDLDSWLADYNFTRLAAVAATGQVTFGRYTTTASAFIPVGSVVKTSDGTQSFTVYADTTNSAYSATLSGFTIPAGTTSITCAVQAQTSGTAGNVAANTITLMGSAISGVDYVTNASAFTNGVAAESDANALARFKLYVSGFSLGTPLAVSSAIAGVQQGLFYQQSYGAGSITVYVDDGSGSPSAALLTRVQTAVQNVRACGTTVAVFGPSVLTVNVAATIVTASGYTHTALTGPAETAIAAYINALPMGSGLSYSRISQIIFDTSAGITDVTNVTLNSGTSALAGVTGQVLRTGSVVVS